MKAINTVINAIDLKKIVQQSLHKIKFSAGVRTALVRLAAVQYERDDFDLISVDEQKRLVMHQLTEPNRNAKVYTEDSEFDIW